ncbi:MAG: hypothetical protein OEZ37_07300 [Gemmatimonadota bacterium]|nr:hypothetical protein [Gemmatimonadota bacterium]
MACHAETLWYVAGRTDSLAALFFLAALVMHARLPERAGPALLLPVAAFALALLTKETAVALPLVAVMWDRWTEGGWRELRGRVPVYGAYAGTLVAYLVLRGWTLGSGMDWVFPYLMDPSDPGFPLHLWTGARSYAENLFAGAITLPFLQADQLSSWTSPFGLGVAAAAMGTIGVTLRKDPRFHILLVMAVGSWLPTAIAYVSERYLYLPSAALAGAVALLLSSTRARPALFRVLAVLVVVWGGHQAMNLRNKHRIVASLPYRTAAVVERLFAPIRDDIPPGADVVWLDFPFDWVSAQFMEQLLRVEFDDPGLKLSILTHVPVGRDIPERLVLTRPTPVTLRAHRSTGVTSRGESLFRWVDCDPGAVIRRSALPFEATIVEGSEEVCSTVDFRFETSLDEKVVIWFRPDKPVVPHPTGRVVDGSLQILEVPPPLEGTGER